MTMQTSRRAVLAGAAALPAMAIPAVALASPAFAGPAGVDPIYAAIDQHRELEKEWWKITDKITAVEDEIEERRPFALIAWRKYSAIGGSEIERARNEFLAEKIAKPSRIEREYRAAKAREQRALAQQADWYQRHGTAPLHEQARLLNEQQDRATESMVTTMPTTAAGCAAVVEYALTDYDVDGEFQFDWSIQLLRNAATALRTLDPSNADAAVQS